MICEFMFFYSKDTNYEQILEILNTYPNETTIITNRSGLNAYLKNKNKKSFMIAEQVPETGNIGEESFKQTKIYHEKFKKQLEKNLHLDISIFEGYTYSLLRKLYLLAQSKTILEKKENTIFIFENYSSIYFSIIKLSSQMGFTNKEQIGFIIKEKLKFFNINEEENLRNNLSKNKLFSFQKNKSKSVSKKIKIKNEINFINKILSLGISRIKFRIKKYSKKNEIKNTTISLNRKIEKINENIDTVFFVTTTRSDLYVKPWNYIFEEFKKSNKSFIIFTSDIVTSMILEKEGLPHVNLFEEMNSLQNYFKNLKNNQFKEFFSKINLENKDILGTKPIIEELLNATFRSVAIITLCDFILKEKNPKSLVGMADGEMLECLAIETAKKYQIPTFSSSPTLPNPHPMLADWFHAEKIFIDGAKHAETFINLGYSKDRILLVGNPKYDLYKNANITDAKNTLEKKFGINKTKKMIIIAMAKWRENDEKWMSNFIKFCNSNKIEIIIKVHPKFKTASNEISGGKIQSIKNSCANLKFLITYDIELLELIPASDLIITDYSSVGLEAVIAGKPLISINFFKENYELFNDLRVDRFGASLYIENYSELEKNILEIFEDKKYINELQRNQEKIVQQYNYYNDGKASNRVFNILQEI
jgi:hypothetical protein